MHTITPEAKKELIEAFTKFYDKYSHSNHTINECIEIVESFPTESAGNQSANASWISVEDGIKPGFAIITDGKNVEPISVYITTSETYLFNNGGLRTKATHWQPLPLPPLLPPVT